jgi:2-polyprenyl-3-methyl-5-hydroxy-6-metoxy-1,4-benzoquinol methylase
VSKSLDPQPKEPTTTFGHCVICGHEASFRFDNEIITPQLKNAWGITDEMADAFNYRESQICSFCGSSLRVRQLCTAIIQTFSEMSGRAYNSFTDLLEDDGFRRLRIAEINACGALHNYLKQHPNLCYSEYVPGIPCGSEYNGIRCEDLQELTYPNDYFDIILTSDTLEHVPEPDKAWSEIRRTLKPGGYHIFTIPVVPSQPVTRQRARLSGGRTEYLTEPAYHGGEWGAEDLLVYTDFAMDVVDALNKLGLSTEVLYYKQGNKDVAFVFRSLKQRMTDVTKMEPAKLEWTGERFLPWIEGAQIHYEHLHRYAFAAHFVKAKKVLDLACGEGYGTYMLAREAEHVVGVEIDKPTVQHARSRYIKDNLEFIEGSILAVPIEGDRRFDVVVCFEGIEHIAEHDKLLSEVKRLLKDDGLFIVSTPNKAVYTDAPDYHNPFHIKELHLDEFKNLLQQYFAYIRIFGQRVYAGSNMWSIDQHKSRGYIEAVVRKGDREFYFAEGISKEPVYFIALASNASLKPLISITDSWLTDASNAFFNDYERRLAELNQTMVAQIHSLESQIHSLESQIYSLESQIQQIQQSIPMQLINRYQRIVERLLRRGTRRRHYYELGLTSVRIILNEGWKSFLRKAWNRLAHRSAAIKKTSS